MEDITLEIGLPLTYYCGSDCYPYEISRIYDSKHICIRPLDSRVIEGTICDENAKIEYISNPSRKELEIKKYKDGWYALVPSYKSDKKVKSSTRYCLRFGVAKKYCDPSF